MGMNKSTLAALSLFAVLVIWYFSFSHVIERPVGIELHFLDVGQGDAIVIYTNQALLVIDGGPSNEILLPRSSAFPLFSCQISKMVLTHPHSDHINGLNRFLQRCEVQNLYFNNISYESSAYFDFLELTKVVQIGSIHDLHEGKSFKIDEITAYVLWPSEELLANSEFTSLNDSSIVLLLDYGQFEVLLTGDIDKEIQNKLSLDNYTSVIDNGIDVYKVPHHGSDGSYDKGFLLSLKPKVAVVSVGKNSYGHPSEQFLNFFKEEKIPLLRTDELGNVVIKVTKTL